MSKNIIGDSVNVTINLKWLLQLLVLTASIVFYTVQLKNRFDEMSNQIDNNMVELQELIMIHEKESESKMVEMQETIKWYQGQLNVNPLSWGKKK